MVWLVILALGVWVAILASRIGLLERRLAELARPVVAPRTAAESTPVPPRPQEAAEPVIAARAPAETQTLQPETALRPPYGAPDFKRSPPPAANPDIPPIQPISTPPQPAESRPAMGAAMSRWLAQNGLAWMGGAALTLGGLFLVVYAAERGFFTPVLRVLAAGAAGALMILASEWIRRQKDAPGGRHLLAAALAAGAGAATLYGAVWAAHSLYGLLPLGVAAVMITLVSAGLLGLSLLHGEALAVLAVLGAFAVPVVTGRGAWQAADLDRFLVILILTGYAVVGVRRWAWTGFAVLAGALAWMLDGLFHLPDLQSALCVGAVAAGAALPVVWLRSSDEGPAVAGPFRLQAEAALLAMSASSVLLWGLAARHPTAALVVVSAFLALAGAAMTAMRLVRGGVFLGPALAPAAGVAFAAAVVTTPPGPTDAILVFALMMVVAGAGLGFGLASPKARTSLVGAAGPGAAALATFAWMAFRHAHAAPSWTLPLAAAVLMSAGAWILARRVEDKATDRGLALWIAGGVELAFLTVQSAAPMHLAPAAHALVALALAGLALRLGWSGLPQAAVVGGLVVLAALLRPAFIGDVLQKRLDPAGFAAVAGAASAELFWAARVMRGKWARESEALGSWSLMVFLLGAFLLIHLLSAGGANRGAGALLEAGLRTDLALAVALVLSQRARDDDGPIARWRLMAVQWLGVAHGVYLQLLLLNPWSGLGEPPMGPPLLDTFALIYLAPAGLLALLTREQRRAPLLSRRLAAVFSLLFGLAWVVLEIRRGFHPIDLGRGAVERAEACGYAVVLLLTARSLWRLRAKSPTAASYLGEAAPIAGTAALAIAALTFCWYASPWWGPRTEPLSSIGEGLLLLAGYAAGVLAAFWLESIPAPRGWSWLAPAALSVGMAELFVMVTLVVRWAFRGADMHSSGAHESVETWAFSAVWAVFGLATLITGGMRRAGLTLRWIGLVVLVGTLGKVLLFDMERLSGVIRAASFLAVGALLISAALAARRLDAGGGFFFGRAKPESQTS